MNALFRVFPLALVFFVQQSKAVVSADVDPDLERFMEEENDLWAHELVGAFGETNSDSVDREKADDVHVYEPDEHIVNAFIDDLHNLEDWISCEQEQRAWRQKRGLRMTKQT